MLAACSSGGAPVDDGPVWPPETPRQPQRLALTAPNEADPLEWWKLNILNRLPVGIYSTAKYSSLAQGIIDETNEVRLAHGLDPVTVLDGLNRAAQAHAFDQATRDYWAHTNPEGLSSRKRTLAATGRTVVSGGENSSIGLTGRETAESIVYGWLNHEGHRELLLNPDVRFIGAGAFQYAGGEPLHFTQLLVEFEE
jgi:uncharacterized protein YkwD